MHIRLLTLALALLTACGDKSETEDGDSAEGDTDTDADADTDGDTDTDADADTDGDTDTDTDAGPFSPQQGHWTFTGGELLTDSCNYSEDVPAGDGDGMMLTVTGDKAFTMQLDGDSVQHACTWADDQTFTCTPAYSETSLASEGLANAYIAASLGFRGDFPASGLVNMAVQLDLDCGGNSGECDLAEYFGDIDFPCQVTFSAFAQAD